MKTITYLPISPFRDDVRDLMNQLNAHHLSHCSPEICHLTTAEEIANFDHLMVGAFSDEQLCGMGAIKFMADYGEITRMFVVDEFRGTGIAKQILDRLVEAAIERNLRSVKLETSLKFTRAVRLYQSYGFANCAPFSDYVHAPYNAYMEKQLSSQV